MSEIPESKKPFDFYQSPWWKDMNNKLCVDGWPQIVVALNCMIRDAKNDYEQLQKQNKELIEALQFYADNKNWEYWRNKDPEYNILLSIYRPDLHSEGKLAREVLAKYQKVD